MRAVRETIIETVIHSDGHAASVPPVSITSVPPVSIASVPPDQRVSVDVKQDHLFRYPSEWDPRETGKTKGGYLEGRIQLPKVNLLKNYFKKQKHLVSGQIPTADDDLHLPRIGPTEPSSERHPPDHHPRGRDQHHHGQCHHRGQVRKGKGNRRDQDKEPVPNSGHWQQEFLVS